MPILRVHVYLHCNLLVSLIRCFKRKDLTINKLIAKGKMYWIFYHMKKQNSLISTFISLEKAWNFVTPKKWEHRGGKKMGGRRLIIFFLNPTLLHISTLISPRSSFRQNQGKSSGCPALCIPTWWIFFIWGTINKYHGSPMHVK